MKNTYFVVVVFLLSLSFSSCEEVVNINLKNAAPKLVVDATINWKKGTPGNEQKIKLTTTTDFYSTEVPIVSGAIIFIKNSTNNIFNFNEIGKTGEYFCSNFIPKIDETYTLTVIQNNQTYTASEKLKSVAPIIDILQNNQGGFTGKNIELKTTFKDPADQDNFYLYRYIYSNQLKFDYYVDQDTFFQGNDFFSLSQNRDIIAGENIEVSHFGISKTFYNYMNVLLSISGNRGGSPFQSPPATVRGNIINTSNTSNFALGYFRLGEVDTRKYTVQ